MLTKFTTKVTCVCLTLVLIGTHAFSQNVIRQFTQVYSENLKGGTSIFGNGIMHIIDNNAVNLTKMNETSNAANGVGGIGFSSTGNDNQNMQFIDIDGTAGTANSSSADLILPAGTNTIKFARLYWGGRILTSTVTGAPDTLRKVLIRKGTSGAYATVTTASTSVDVFNVTTTETIYQSYVDVTSFLNANGGGTYTVANIPASAGSIGGGGRYGGWTIIVAYENATQPFNSVRVYDGFAQVFSGGNVVTLNINLSGLNVPNNPLTNEEATLSTMAWEGDANLGASAANPAGDFIRINNIAVTNAVNPVANFWNGSVSRNGAFVTTKNPNYSNQMGIDIDELNVGTGYNILPNATSVNFQFGTEADQYFPSLFTFSIRMKDPLVTLDKTVADASGNNFVEPNEELTYTLSGSNQGVAPALNAFIVDTLPNNVTYVPNSLEVISAPGVTAGIKTDAADGDIAVKGINGTKHFVKFNIGEGATNAAGGELPAASTFAVRFKVTAGAIPGTITNTARITANSQAGDVFTDDGSAVIGESGGPVPVKFTSFKAQLVNNNNAIVKWSTESELDNDRFEVERSDDGVNFTTRGRVRGSGTTSITRHYDFPDQLNTTASIIYYRLKIVDTDGKFTYSKIVPLKLKGSFSLDKITVYPNPFVSDIKVMMNSQVDAVTTFRVLSFDGKELLRRLVPVQKGDNIIVMKDFGSFANGTYILEISNGNEKTIQRIVKN